MKFVLTSTDKLYPEGYPKFEDEIKTKKDKEESKEEEISESEKAKMDREKFEQMKAAFYSVTSEQNEQKDDKEDDGKGSAV